MNPGKGFKPKPGQFSSFKPKVPSWRRAAGSDDDDCGCCHQDPHGVYRDVDSNDVRATVRAYRVPGRDDSADHDTTDEAPRETKRRSTFKRSKPKQKKGADPLDVKYLAACRGEQCYLRISGICQARGWGSETVVPAHRNEGKGMGLKVPDEFTVPACYACHAEFDQGRRFDREAKRAMWNRAFRAWEPVRREKLGIMEIPEGVTV